MSLTSSLEQLKRTEQETYLFIKDKSIKNDIEIGIGTPIIDSPPMRFISSKLVYAVKRGIGFYLSQMARLTLLCVSKFSHLGVSFI